MLTWSILMVGVLLLGAAVLATLAVRLRDEVAAIEATLTTVLALGPVQRELADEITRTQSRRSGVPAQMAGESLSPRFRR